MKENEKRIPELVEIAYKLAMDESISERDRIKATDLIFEKALPRSSQGISRSGLILDADELEERFSRPVGKVYDEQTRLIAEYYPTEATGSLSSLRKNELIPILEIRVNKGTCSAEADFRLPNGEVITRRS